MLMIESVTKQFGKGCVAVDSVSLRIEAGEMVGIIGRSGSGKSTLLRLISRLVEPTSGRIHCGATEVTALQGKQLLAWRAECAMVFQQFNLVERLDVITNVLTGRLRHRNTVASLLTWFSRSERIMALSMLSELDLLPQALQRVETLSGGQKQRVAIARALLQEPRLVLADEPVASLDPQNADQVMQILSDINQRRGLTVLCNLHSVALARRYCTRIIGLRNGQVAIDSNVHSLSDSDLDRVYGRGADTVAATG